MNDALPSSPADARIDKWLWCVRACATRPDAAEACRRGRVLIDDRPAKPATSVRPGQLVLYRDGILTRRLRVLGLPRARLGAAALGPWLRDETPPEDIAAAREARALSRLAGGGARPDKHDRRARAALRLGDTEGE